MEAAREDLDRALAAWPFSAQDPLLEVLRRAGGGDVTESARAHSYILRKQVQETCQF